MNQQKKINHLIKHLIKVYPQFSFLKESEALDIRIQGYLSKKQRKIKPLRTTTYPIQPSSIKDSDGKIEIKPNHIEFKPNYYHGADNKVIKLSTVKSIELFDNLIMDDMKLSSKEDILLGKIEESLSCVFNNATLNNTIKAIKFANLDKKLFARNILDLFRSLLTSRQLKKLSTFYKTPLKLTNFCYLVGDLFFKTFCMIHFDTDLKTFLTKHLHEDVYIGLLNSLAINEELINDTHFQKLFDITLSKELEDYRDSVKKRKKSPRYYPIYIKDKLTDSLVTHTYQAGQLFYILFKMYIQSDKKENLELEQELIKNKIKLGSVFVHAFEKVNLFKLDTISNGKGKQKQLVFVPNKDIFPDEIFTRVYQRPYFVHNTLSTLVLQYKNTQHTAEDKHLYNVYYTRNDLTVRTNREIALEGTVSNKFNQKIFEGFSGQNYFSNFEKYTSFVGTIDKNYLYNFLLKLTKHMKRFKQMKVKTFQQLIKEYSDILYIYKIKPEEIKDLYKTSNSRVKLCLKKLVKNLLVFERSDREMFIENLSKILAPRKQTIAEKINYKKYYNILLTLYNKIQSYKIFLKGLLIESVVYSHFNYFILDTFLDTRGRHYLNGFYMNPQSYPLVKAFIKPFVYRNQLKTTDYEKLKVLSTDKSNNTLIFSQAIKVDLESIFKDYNTFIKQDKELKLQNIYELLTKPKQDFNQFRSTIYALQKDIKSSFKLFNKIFSYVKGNTSSIKNIHVVHSALLLFLNPSKNINNYYQLDATASGLQMTSLVLRDRQLGELCNLVEPANKTELKKDVYSIFAAEGSQIINTLINNLAEFTIPDVIKTSIQSISDTITKKGIVHLDLTLFDSFYDWFTKETNLKTILFDNQWLLFDNKFKKERFYKIRDLTKKEFNLIYNGFICLSNYIKLKELLSNKTYSWLMPWLSGRDVFKKAIMTFGYNATAFRRKEDFLISLSEKNENQRTSELLFFAKILENIFQKLKTKYLQPLEVLKMVGNILAESLKDNTSKETSITIKNGIFNIKLECYRHKTLKVQTQGLRNKTWHEFITKMPVLEPKVKGGILYKAVSYTLLKRKFSPHFIHSMDAWIVCLFRYRIATINALFGKDYFINSITNHDTFSLTLAPLLKYLLMDIYKSIYFVDYIRTLESNFGYHNLIKFWDQYHLKNNAIPKLDFRYETILGSNVSVSYKNHPKDFNELDAGATTEIDINPHFLK